MGFRLTALIAEQFPLEQILPKHLSASALSDYLTCPLRWYGSRVVKWPRPPASAPLAGTAFHAAVELHHRDNDEDADPETELVQRWKAVKPVMAEERVLGKAVLVDLARSLQALDLYRERFPRQDYDGTEEFFTATVPEVPVPLIGYMDVVTSTNIIRDIKTTASSSWTQEKADADLQATIYCYAFHQMTGVIPEFEFVVLYTGVQRPVSLTVIPTVRTPKHFEGLELLVREVYERMQQSEHLLASCKPASWCNFNEQCELFMVDRRQRLGEPEPKKRARRETTAPVVKLREEKPASLFAGRSVLAALGGPDD